MSDYSWLFGNGSSGISNSNGINLSDYAMIKNGSYKKLMKAYYSDTKSENKGSIPLEGSNIINYGREFNRK